MVGVKMLHDISARLQQIFDTDKAFGGVSVIVFGDLRQLPPVGDGYVFSASSVASAYAGIVSGYLWEKFKFYELTEVMRQREDRAFAVALSDMAEEKMTAGDVAIFKRRHLGERFNDAAIPRHAVCLLRTNSAVKQFNDERLKLYQDDVAESVAVDRVRGVASDNLKKQFLLATRKLNMPQCFGLAYVVPLHVGARYMITVNVDTADGIVNGACGVLKRIDRNTGSDVAVRIWLKLDDADAGAAARSGLDTAGDITPLDKCVRAIKTKRGFSNIYVNRRQFPVTPAEAITVHKSQGGTYAAVAGK